MDIGTVTGKIVWNGIGLKRTEFAFEVLDSAFKRSFEQIHNWKLNYNWKTDFAENGVCCPSNLSKIITINRKNAKNQFLSFFNTFFPKMIQFQFLNFLIQL